MPFPSASTRVRLYGSTTQMCGFRCKIVKLSLQILHVRVVSGAEIFFYRHGGGCRHVLSICIRCASVLVPW
jgi:hypothetical protein